MSAQGGRVLASHPDSYWIVQARQLENQLSKTHAAVAQVSAAQTELLALSPTERLNSPAWKTAAEAAKYAMRNARRERTILRKKTYDLLDVLRIRPVLADACPQSVKDRLYNCTSYIDVLEAHGF